MAAWTTPTPTSRACTLSCCVKPGLFVSGATSSASCKFSFIDSTKPTLKWAAEEGASDLLQRAWTKARSMMGESTEQVIGVGTAGY